jgi:hypothetical protein
VQPLQAQGTDSVCEHRGVGAHTPDRVGLGEPAFARFVPDDGGLGGVVLPGNPVAQRDGHTAAHPVVQRTGSLDQS